MQRKRNKYWVKTDAFKHPFCISNAKNKGFKNNNNNNEKMFEKIIKSIDKRKK